MTKRSVALEESGAERFLYPDCSAGGVQPASGARTPAAAGATGLLDDGTSSVGARRGDAPLLLANQGGAPWLSSGVGNTGVPLESQ